MKSMTGYGRGESTQEGYKITAEITSVNRRQSEVNVYLPRELETLEPLVRNMINNRVARGKVTARLNLHASEKGYAKHAQVNVALAKAYAAELRQLAKELKISQDVSLETLVRAPGVFETDAALGDPEHLWPGFEKALNQALDGLIKMRSKEGDHLEKDLRQRVQVMRKAVARVEKEAPQMTKRYTEALRERVANAGLPLPAEDDERLLKEIVYFADRSDITEELTRLQSHFAQFEDAAASKEPVGRTLDFLAQEMNREVNTIGSKSADSSISKEVVLLKAEVERFREQVQNVE
jgi:uncharacterized protein (TIGR00255 family)